MSDADENWTIHPGRGFGKLTFGLSAAEVDSLSGIYGPVVSRESDRIPDDELQEAVAEMNGGLNDQEREEVLAIYNEIAPDETSITEVRGESGLVLGYQDDRLVEIELHAGRHRAFIEGKDLLALKPEMALALAETHGQEVGSYIGYTAYFPKLALIFDGFCEVTRRRPVALPEWSEELEERLIAVLEEVEPEENAVRYSWLGKQVPKRR